MSTYYINMIDERKQRMNIVQKLSHFHFCSGFL